jgi:hypothetical protein
MGRGSKRRGEKFTGFGTNVTQISPVEAFSQFGDSLKVDISVFGNLCCVDFYNIKSP